MSEHDLNDLIRTINPVTFSANVNGAGHRIVLVDGEASLYVPRRFDWLRGGRSRRHVFVKKVQTPRQVKGWSFTWSEGTTDVSLDFEASFVIEANEDVHALALAKKLSNGPEEAGEALYGVISAHLHQALGNLLQSCNERSASLLDEFDRSAVGYGESTALNLAVTTAVSQALGGAPFRIGFRMKDPAPRQIEVQCTDAFTLQDSNLNRQAVTTALLQLENFQAYRKSGLKTEAAVREAVARKIGEAVKERLFAKNYYEVVRSFAQGEKSIKRLMEAKVQDFAKGIGYRVKLFQTFPDIAALELFDGKRIEVPAALEKYPLLNSGGFVRLSIDLRVRVVDDFSRLNRLVDPDARDLAEPIILLVRQSCRDTLQRFDHRTFNLEFADAVAPRLQAAIVRELAKFGLEAEVLGIRPEPTEEASRYEAIRGRSIEFSAEISPQADFGDADPVCIEGAIEVIGLTPDGWAQFQAKDYGYREDSRRNEADLRQQAQERGVALVGVMDRRALAIAIELTELRERAIATLSKELSMVPGLARNWTTLAYSREIEKRAKEIVENAIADEFGLAIALRSLRRGETRTDKTFRLQLDAKHEQLRRTAHNSAEKEVMHQIELRALLDENERKRVAAYGKIELAALADENDKAHAQTRERIAREAQELDEARRRVSVDANALLPPPRPPQLQDARLPWEGDDSPGK